MLLSLGYVNPLRLAQTDKDFRGTHDISLQGRRLNLEFCVFSHVQEAVNRLTDYSNVLVFLSKSCTLCHPLNFPERKYLASYFLEPHYLPHSSSRCSDLAPCISYRLAPRMVVFTSFPVPAHYFSCTV
jgi:hypothetical protein